MNTGVVTYNETHDLYLQMLSEARKLEDRRLAKMLVRRILDHQQHIDVPEPLFKNIVSLPTSAALAGPVEPEIPFWAKGLFWQELFQFLSFLTVGMLWLLYFFYLITQA